MTSERECINRILHYVQNHDREYLVKGIGDDCAVLKKDEDNCLLLTTDTLVEGVHFDLAWHPPYLLGRKCASVNLSDIAAMGGQPRTCLLSIGFPGSVPSWFDDFMSGFTSVLTEHDTLLVGGDTVKSQNDLIITVTVTGEGDRKQICYRSGARPGDLIWVSGSLGNATAGLELCRRWHPKPDQISDRWQPLIQAHLDPEAQIDLGRVLSSCGLVHAMMDISDGLATDLAHLCTESGVGAEIQQDLLPVSMLLESAAKELDAAVIDWVLKGGEDYQLLFTTKASDEQKIIQLVSDESGREISCLGKIVKDQGVFLYNYGSERKEISYQGYDHFVGE
jgi:thiamine-monophosphate kinase